MSGDSQSSFQESSCADSDSASVLAHPQTDIFAASNDTQEATSGVSRQATQASTKELISMLSYNFALMRIRSVWGFIAESHIYRPLEGTQIVRSEEGAHYDGALYCGDKDLRNMTFAQKLEFARSDAANDDLWCYQDAKLMACLMRLFDDNADGDMMHAVYTRTDMHQSKEEGGAPAMYQMMNHEATGLVSLISLSHVQVFSESHQMGLDIAVPWKLAWCSLPLELLPEYYERLVTAIRTKTTLVVPGTNVKLDVSKLPMHGPEGLFPPAGEVGANSRSFIRLGQQIERSPCAKEHGVEWNICDYQPLVGDAQWTEPGHAKRIVQLKEGLHEEDHVAKTVDIFYRNLKMPANRKDASMMAKNPFNPWRMEHYLCMFGRNLDHLYWIPASSFKFEWWTADVELCVPMAELSEFRVEMGDRDWFADVYEIVSKYPEPMRPTQHLKAPDIAACYAQGRVMSKEEKDAEIEAITAIGDRKNEKRNDNLPWWHIERFNRVCAAHARGLMIPMHSGPFLNNVAFFPYRWTEQDLAMYKAIPGKLPLSANCVDLDLNTPLLLISLLQVQQGGQPTIRIPSEPVSVNALRLEVEDGFPRLHLVSCTDKQYRQHPHPVLLIPSEHVRNAEILDRVRARIEISKQSEPSIRARGLREWWKTIMDRNYDDATRHQLGSINLRNFVDGHLHEFMVQEGEEMYDSISAFYWDQFKEGGAPVSRYGDGPKIANTQYLIKFGDLLQACADHWWPQMARWESGGVADSDATLSEDEYVPSDGEYGDDDDV